MSRVGVRNRSGAAYEELRAGILAGRWAPDARLSTYRLAEELGMSRTPVIEALKRLEADGLIEIVPQVGCRVLAGAHEEIDEGFLIRASLEGLAAEVAATRITAPQLEQLEELCEAAERAIAGGDAEAYGEANRPLHRLIVRASGMSNLEDMLEGIWTLHRHRLASSGFLALGMRASGAEHRAILDALKAGDPAAAREATATHMQRCGADYRAFASRVAAGDGQA